MIARISLTMIVKNEAATLDRCLASVHDLVDEIIVVDTGSSDNTKHIAGQHGARVFDFPWPESFAAARNESLHHATGQWVLWLDGDEYFDDANREKLRNLIVDLEDSDTAYVMKCLCVSASGINSGVIVDHVRLFRRHSAVRWDYRVHEQILPAIKRCGHAVLFTEIIITHTGYTDPSLRFKKFERNLRLLHQDLAERPDDPFTLFNLGWSYADLGRIPDAIPLLQRSLQHSHNADSIPPKLYSFLTHCHLLLRQYDQAWAICKAGQARCPDDAELLFLKGQLCHQRGDRAVARICWMQLLADSPHPQRLSPWGRVEMMTDGVSSSVDAGLRGPLVRHNLALLDREEGHFADAEKQWRAILDEAPEYHPARLGLAELYLGKERWPELETILAGLEPHAPLDATVLRARMHMARKEFALARQLLEDALSQAPRAMTANVFLSHVLLQSGDESAAEPLLRRIVAMDPTQGDSWRNLIVLYRRQNRLSEAIAAARTACRHCSPDTDLLLLQGALLQEGGDCTVEKEEHRTLGIKNNDRQRTSEAWHTNQRSSCTMTARISLTMIVKNEAATLGRCLASVRDLVDEIIVVDTGSSDNTKEIACQHGARVFDLPWPDSFAAARNESLRHASGQWILWLDADEHFDDANRDKLRHLLASLGEDNTAFVLKCVCLPGQAGNSTTNVDHVRLFRNHPAIRWDYRVHEQILPAIKRAGHAVRFTDIAITHTGYTDPALRHKKLERNLRLLHLDMAERPNDPFTLFNLGWSYADLGRLSDAIPLLQRSLQHSHNADSITPKLYSLLSHCHRRLGQYAQAWSVCKAGQVRCPDDAELLFLKGQLCHERGDRTAARACWMQLLDVRSLTVAAPTDGVFTSIDAGLHGPLVRHHLAVLDREEGHLADAEKHWRSILDDTPDFHPARLGLAELYLLQERWPEMETLLTELQPHAPLDTAILQARMNLARQDFAAARQLLEEAIQKRPQLLPAQVILSHVLLQSGDERAAEPQLRRIVEMDARQAESWKNLAVLYRRTQRLREAIAAAKAGCLHCPHDAELLLLQGALLREGGDALNAETCLMRVLEMAIGNGPAPRLRTTARQHLIALYRGLGRHREAEAHSRALAVEDPDSARRLAAALPKPRPAANGQAHASFAC